MLLLTLILLNNIILNQDLKRMSHLYSLKTKVYLSSIVIYTIGLVCQMPNDAIVLAFAL